MALADHGTPAGRRRLERGLWGGGLVLLASLSLTGFAAWRVHQDFLFSPTTPATSADSRVSTPVPLAASAAVAFRSTHAGAEDAFDSAASRYRYVGPFFIWSEAADGGRTRQAIVEDVQNGEQHLVSEGDRIDDLRIVRIRSDRIRVTLNGRDEDLSLAFAAPPESVYALGKGARETEPGEEEEGDSFRYGRRIGENRWVLERDALMGFYYDLLDDPIRIAQLYRSFESVPAEDEDTDGYRLRIRGEKEFLHGVGLQDGDHVRAVNSLPITNQSRAEYFLGEFVRDDLGVVVLDIERDGEPEKLIFMIR